MRKTCKDCGMEIKPQISLVDGEELHYANPDTFQLPTYRERMALQPGAVAKMIFEPDLNDPHQSPERMWVRVTSGENGEYVGVLENTPLTLPLEWGTEVRFSAKHVIDIHECEEGGHHVVGK